MGLPHGYSMVLMGRTSASALPSLGMGPPLCIAVAALGEVADISTAPAIEPLSSCAALHTRLSCSRFQHRRGSLFHTHPVCMDFLQVLSTNRQIFCFRTFFVYQHQQRCSQRINGSFVFAPFSCISTNKGDLFLFLAFFFCFRSRLFVFSMLAILVASQPLDIVS